MKLTILGASGHGRVVADIAEKLGYTEIDFLDDNPQLKFCGKYPVTGTTALAATLTHALFVAMGDRLLRARMLNELFEQGKSVATLVHPKAVVAATVELGKGTVVMAGAVINPNVRVGRGCIVNTCASIDHDCVVGDYVHVAVGAHLCGAVTVGDLTLIGAGATVINNLNIAPDIVVGAGGVVVKSLEFSGIYVGVPTHLKKRKFPGGGIFNN